MGQFCPLFVVKETEYGGAGAAHTRPQGTMAHQKLPDGGHLSPQPGGEHVLKDVVHPPGHPFQVPGLQGGEHPGGVRVAAELFHPHLGEQLRGGDGEGGLAHHEKAGRQRRQIRQDLPPAPSQDRAPPEAEGHVAAHPGGRGLQRLPGHVRGVGPAEGPEHRRAVRAAAGHAGADGDALVDGDGEAGAGPVRFGEEGPGRPGGQVALVPGQKGQVRLHFDGAVGPGNQRQIVPQVHSLHDHAQLMVAVGPLPQDVQGESFDYPDYFFQKRVHRITRPVAVEEELEDIAEIIAEAKKPLVIVGGGVRYSEAGETIEKFCEEFKIPFGESQAGKSACKSGHPYCLGGIGVTGTYASNIIAEDADVVIAIGSRMSDFTTSSKRLFKNPDVKFVTINNCRFHAYKMDAAKAVGDAKVTVEALAQKLRARGYVSAYNGEIEEAKKAWDKEMVRLAGIEYTGDDFEPIIKARDPRTIPEFVKMTNGKITQTAALAAIRRVIDEDATIITAGGSLPSCMQRMWTTDKRGGYHAEYGYSCMGYEVAATLGVKFAEPDNEVYCVVGDSSFQMLHSEIMTIMQERKKVNILVFDNCGFGCINNLEMNHGIGSIATEFRYTDGKKPCGDLIPVDYAKIGEGYGLKTYTCKTIAELEAALEDAKKQEIACLFDLKVIPKTMTDGYESWWNVGIATTSSKESVRKACEGVLEGRREARDY